EREVDLRPRNVAPEARSTSLGDVHAKIDLSPYLAALLLGLFVAELSLRALAAGAWAPKAAGSTGASSPTYGLATGAGRSEDTDARLPRPPSATPHEASSESARRVG